LPEPATGRAGACHDGNQRNFMVLMGLIDDDERVSSQFPAFEAPVTDAQFQFLQQAASHDNYPQLYLNGSCDGYYTRDQLSLALDRVGHGEPQQCECSAHAAVFSTEHPVDVKDDIKELIRSPPVLETQDLGLRFIIALLKRLLSFFGMDGFQVVPAGRQHGVSYVLSKNSERFHFRGYPDFVVLKEQFGARQILVCTGEIQSTSDPDTQNSIYAVGLLLKLCSQQNRPILCINLFKEKWANLAIARLTQQAGGPPNSVGKVSLKYICSSSPINLKQNLKLFANRLYVQLKLLEEK
jgi:hypothetical protein